MLPRRRSELITLSRLVRAPLTIGSASLAALVLALAALQPISNADTFGHLGQGRVIAARGGPPALDPFSFWRAEPQPWVNYEWLSDWLTWAARELAGYDGLVALAMMIVAGSGAALVLLCGRYAGPGAAWLSSLSLIVVVPAVRFRLSARPHLIALPFAVLYLVLLTSERAFADRRRALGTTAILALAHVLWTNLHGSHLLGLAIAGTAALAALPDRARAAKLAGITLALAIASCISPYGPAMAVDAALHVFDPAYRAVVSEWQPLSTLGWSWTTATAAAYVLALALIARHALRGGLATRTWLGVAVLLAVAAFRSLRFVEEMLLLGAPLVALVFAERASEPLARVLRAPLVGGATALALLVCGAGVVAVDSELGFGAGVDLRFVPGEAAEHVEAELGEARVLGSMPTSWYLLHGAPSARVLVDGRVPFYGPEHVRAATHALSAPDALRAMTERFGVDTIVVQHTAPDEAPVAVALAHDPSFVRSWIDGSYVVYVTSDLAARRGIDPARFDDLPGGYDPGAILGADDRTIVAIREDLANLGPGPDARAFASFVRAMLRLRPLAREAGWAGYRAPRDEGELARAELAWRELDATRARIGRVPVVAAQAMLVATLVCRLDEARALLEEARREEEARETIFGRAELDLRAGDVAAVRAFLDAARAMPGAEGDPWIAELERSLGENLRCAR